jgi:hypothetical protein
MSRWRRTGGPRDERPVGAIPRSITAGFVALLALQVALRAFSPAPRAAAVDLDAPPRVSTLRVASLGEPAALAYGGALRLQAFDSQPGISLPYAALDYGRLERWLEVLLALDPAAQYPLVMASHLYAQVGGQPDKQRSMSEFVYREFLRDPDRRWPWLAHVAIMARHRLHDLPRAIRYADAIRDHAKGSGVPSWARQMHIFLREDAGEVEAAKALLGGLLASGTITDPREIAFLTERLHAMAGDENSTRPSKP